MLSRGGDVSSFPAKEIHTLGILGAEKQRVAGLGCSLSVSGELNGAVDAHDHEDGHDHHQRMRPHSLIPPLSLEPNTVPGESQLLNKLHE